MLVRFRNQRTLISVLRYGVLLTLIACKENLPGEDGSPSNVVFPPNDVRYSLHVQPLFNQACALPACHDDGSNQSALRLTSYGDAVLAVPGIVVAGSPENSTLVIRIEGRAGQPMPLFRNPLNQNQINGIRTWITEGAKNN
jgi:hypothetical protein